MKPLQMPSNREEHAYMLMRKTQNVKRALVNPNENWMWKKLQKTTYKWSRQARYGYRIFDFWCHRLGVAIEVDGPEHNEQWDVYRDEYNFRHSGIIVLHVHNLDEEQADRVIGLIDRLDTWQRRKSRLGLRGKRKKSRRKKRVNMDRSRSLAREYLVRFGWH